MAVDEDVDECKHSDGRTDFSPHNKRHRKNPAPNNPNAPRRNKKQTIRKAEKKEKKSKVFKKKYSPTTLASWHSIIWQFCRHSGWGDIKKECPIIGDMIKKLMKVLYTFI